VLLTLSTTHQPATDLGFLLHKNPARPQKKALPFGDVHVFYPKADDAECVAVLMLDVDPINLVRGRPGKQVSAFALGQYVNDRPYAAGSFLSVAIAQVYGSALGGRSNERPALVDQPIPLAATVHGLPCRGGEGFLRELFEPLGYDVTAQRLPLDENFSEWGEGRYFNVTLTATTKLADLLGHLYVLIPVLDDQKHYYVGQDELEKLLHRGEGWLGEHPLREEIARRYLNRRGSLVRQALERLIADEPVADDEPAQLAAEEAVETAAAGGLSVHEQRLHAVIDTLKNTGSRRVLDLGCGEGRLLRHLLADRQFERIVGVDVSPHTLDVAERRLKFERLPEAKRARIDLAQGALTYRDKRLEPGGDLAGPGGFDAAVLVEVIEHLDLPRLPALGRVVFGHVAPPTVVVTTPNADYNAVLPTLPAGQFRHRDHRFEWGREAFGKWCDRIAAEFGYAVDLTGVGPADEAAGSLSQMAVFRKAGDS
jgi:3' terminal RNA ribose 2'-O-methyltransferase Hen1